ncbi:UNVERIFIED_CONTAM: hypothetical protein NCL1_13159 [Trichonephila clavipes]
MAHETATKKQGKKILLKVYLKKDGNICWVSSLRLFDVAGPAVVLLKILEAIKDFYQWCVTMVGVICCDSRCPDVSFSHIGQS